MLGLIVFFQIALRIDQLYGLRQSVQNFLTLENRIRTSKMIAMELWKVKIWVTRASVLPPGTG